jgi:hypothetical protein
LEYGFYFLYLMTENQLCELFDLSAAGRFEEMSMILANHGQHLAALLVQNPIRHCENIAALAEQVAAGELDPVLVGTTVWALTPTSSLQYLEPGSPIWRGVPASACRELERAGAPPDQGVDRAWAHAKQWSAETPSDSLGLVTWAFAYFGGTLDEKRTRLLHALSADHALDYPYVLAIIIDLALHYFRQHVPEPARSQCMEALARAQGAPPPHVPLVLPPVII